MKPFKSLFLSYPLLVKVRSWYTRLPRLLRDWRGGGDRFAIWCTRPYPTFFCVRDCFHKLNTWPQGYKTTSLPKARPYICVELFPMLSSSLCWAHPCVELCSFLCGIKCQFRSKLRSSCVLIHVLYKMSISFSNLYRIWVTYMRQQLFDSAD